MTSNANLVHEMIYYRSSAGDHPCDDLEGFELDHFRSLKLKRMGSLKMREQIKSLTFRPNLVSFFPKSGPYCRGLTMRAGRVRPVRRPSGTLGAMGLAWTQSPAA